MRYKPTEISLFRNKLDSNSPLVYNIYLTDPRASDKHNIALNMFSIFGNTIPNNPYLMELFNQIPDSTSYTYYEVRNRVRDELYKQGYIGDWRKNERIGLSAEGIPLFL